uniref:Sperm acrosome associated 7 n=1 Tax=Mus musculus TaxID=10090 RepID=A0A1B0GRI6_MOUSE
MAANRGSRTFLSVFLLCCWQGAELQPIKTTSGQHTEKQLSSPPQTSLHISHCSEPCR